MADQNYDYDVLVIGAGPGGYVAAIRAAQLGLKTACAESRETLGGTCLNVGCIPSKAMLHASEYFDAASNGSMESMGIDVTPKLNLDKMHAQRRDAVKGLTGGIEFLFKKNKIDWLKGWGSIPEAGKVTVGEETHEARNIVIASGSEPASIPGADVAIDEKVVVTSTGALDLGKIPKSMVVIGGGVIGLEMGSVYARLGTKVTVVEYLDAITPGMDGEVQKTFQRILKKQGLDFVMGVAVHTVQTLKAKARVAYRLRKDDSEHELDADVVLVATGRKPYTEGLGLADLGVEMTPRGQIAVGKDWQTSVKGIYAIGDAIPGPMLAHKAEDEGVALAEILAGQAGHVNYDVIPSVVYTQPEVASVGKTEEELKKDGVAYNVGKFPFMANGRARAMETTDGFVKVLADKETDRVLGVHIVGFGAGEMIHEAAVLMEFGGSAEDLGRTCHAHPTMSEAVKEAALGAFFKPIHM